MIKSKLKLGEILIKEGLITEAQMNDAMAAGKKTGARLGEVLIKSGKITEKDMAFVLGKQLSIPFVSLASGMLTPAHDQDLDKLVPFEFAKSNLILPISRNLDSLTVAFVDPTNVLTIDNLKHVTKCEINPVITTKTDMEDAIEKFYSSKSVLEEAISDTYSIQEETEVELKQDDSNDNKLNLDKVMAEAREAPVVKLVNFLLSRAVTERASDIHIEPFEGKMKLRLRIDGVLHEIAPPSPHLLPSLISRIKILSRLDIAEKRLPQDGGFSLKVGNKPIDARISTVPTVYGEKVVIRILDKGNIHLDLTSLGFEQNELKIFERAIASPYGLIFITGPTGSGKTTTLYAALKTINSPERNILTIEDPVEIKLEGINQVQIKPNIGLTFAAGLRSFLRQDPDVILVGEVRDLETAEICVRAALTGHLVFSTLHTNDAPSAISRLVDIGVEPYLLTPSLVLIVAQRLIRRLCDSCKIEYEPTEKMRKDFSIQEKKLYKPKGCEKCGNTGYKGRVGIYEMLAIDDNVRDKIARSCQVDAISQAGKEAGMRTLREAGIDKVKKGVTSIEEVLSATL